ncbi:hypothetical protein ES708_35074 [subsurface metagenome]
MRNQLKILLGDFNRLGQIAVFIKSIFDFLKKLEFLCLVSFVCGFCLRSRPVGSGFDNAKPREGLHNLKFLPLRTNFGFNFFDKIAVCEFRVRQRFSLRDLFYRGFPFFEFGF